MFITLTHRTGRALVNVDHIVSIVEHEGRVYISPRVGRLTEIVETYDDVIAKIENSRSKVW